MFIIPFHISFGELIKHITDDTDTNFIQKRHYNTKNWYRQNISVEEEPTQPILHENVM